MLLLFWILAIHLCIWVSYWTYHHLTLCKHIESHGSAWKQNLDRGSFATFCRLRWMWWVSSQTTSTFSFLIETCFSFQGLSADTFIIYMHMYFAINLVRKTKANLITDELCNLQTWHWALWEIQSILALGTWRFKGKKQTDNPSSVVFPQI